MSRSIEEVCRNVYQETREFYERVAPELGDQAAGFRILYGPPIFEPPALFIGYQPGGAIADAYDHQSWPTTCEYAVAAWPLALRLREIFDASQLARCTGLNAVFFRAPNLKAWRDVPSQLRRDIEAFCIQRAERLVGSLKPREIIIIGLGTFDRLVPKKAAKVSLTGTAGVLAKTGMLWGSPVEGIRHLSGDRIRNADRAKIADFLRARIKV